MKTLQKATLAVAIAAVPFMATNALEALDDDVLSNMTGQAGVTIETTTTDVGTKIGHIIYTDTDGLAQGANSGGSVAIVGDLGGDAAGYAMRTQGGTYAGVDYSAVYQGAYDSTYSSTYAAEIANAADPANPTQAESDAAAAAAADAAKAAGNAAYAAAHTAAWNGSGSTTVQTIDVDSFGDLVISKTSANQTRLQIKEVQLRSRAQQTAGTNGAVLVSNLDLVREDGDGETRIVNLTEAANVARFTPDGTKTYYRDVTGSKITDADKIDISGAIGSSANLVIVTKGESKIVNMNVDALDGAIEIRGLSYDDGAGGMMKSNSVIWAVGGDSSVGGGVYIQGSDSVGTLKIQSVGIGGSSIGTLEVANINQAGNRTRIYGH